MKDVKTIIAKNLIALRKSKGLTQVELAEKLNYSDKAVSRWEHGETLPDVNVLYELCTFYGITMNDLVSEEYNPANTNPNEEKNAKLYRVWLGVLTAVVVLLFATVWFAYSQITGNGYWIAFIWAVPVACVVLLYTCRSVFNWVAKFVFASICTWSGITALYLHMLICEQANLWTVFLIGVPIEALAFLWQKTRKYKE